MSMDYPNVGDFAQADVLVEGNKILAVGPHIAAGTADVIDATGRIVMPGFIDTHHHQFETALRSYLADGVLINDGSGTPSGSTTYYEFILNKFAPVYRPQDVYINELFGGLSQLDDGVTTVHDVSQISHTPAALGRRHSGADRYRAPRRLRLFRERRQFRRRRSGQPISARRAAHPQEAVFCGVGGQEVALPDVAMRLSSLSVGSSSPQAYFYFLARLGRRIQAQAVAGVSPPTSRKRRRHPKPAPPGNRPSYRWSVGSFGVPPVGRHPATTAKRRPSGTGIGR